MLYWFAYIFIRPIAFLLLRPRIRGWKHLFFRGKAIFVSNHWALTDPILLAIVSPRIIHFMAKKELFDSKASRFFMKMLYAFPVDRGKADLISLRQAMTVLNRGKVFGIFPEGKRSITGDLDELEKGAAFLALRCDAPIIPIYSDPKTFRRFRIRMTVGEPIHAAEVAKLRGGKPVEVVTEAIEHRLMELRMQMETM